MNKITNPTATTKSPLKEECEESGISLLSFDLLLMISNYLEDDDFHEFLTTFQYYPAFKPFLCLLELYEVEGIFEIWPLAIHEELSPEGCQLVHDASFLSKTVNFSGSSPSILEIVKLCDITPFRKVMLELCEVELTPQLLTQLQELKLNELIMGIIMCNPTITGTSLMEALSRMHQLRSLSLKFEFDKYNVWSDIFPLIGLMKSLTKLSLSGGDFSEEEGFSDSDCEVIGEALKSTIITDLNIIFLCLDGLVVISAALRDTLITNLSLCVDPDGTEWSTSDCKQFWNNMADSKVECFVMDWDACDDDFALQLSSTKNLNLKFIHLMTGDLTWIGFKHLVQMDIPNLRKLYIDSRYSEKFRDEDIVSVQKFVPLLRISNLDP